MKRGKTTEDELEVARQKEIRAIKNSVKNAELLQFLPISKIKEIRNYLESVSYGAVKPFKF